MAIGTSPVNQAVGTWTTGTTIPVTVAAPTSGNFVLAGAGLGGGAFTVSSETQTNVAWNAAADITKNVSRDLELWSGIANASAGTTATTNLSATGNANSSVNASEWSGVATSGALDQTASASGTTSAPTITITPTAGLNQLIVVACKTANQVETAPAGWTALTDNGTGNSPFLAYQVVASTSGSYTATWPTSASAWVAVAACYKAPAAGATSWGPDLSDQLNRIVQ